VRNSVRSRHAAARHIGSGWQVDANEAASGEELDLFYAIWAEELLKTAVQSLMADYHREGKGDYFRILHTRICEEMAVKEIAAALDVKTTDVDNYYRHARQRLADRIDHLVRKDAACYTEMSDLDDEFQHERQRLSEILQRQGGLEAAVRNAMSPKDLKHAVAGPGGP
jgi:hypothetical protein